MFVPIALAGLLHPLSLAQFTGGPNVANASSIEGNVAGPDGKGAGTRVLAYHLSSGKLYRSEPTGNNGSFRIGNLPYGYFDLAVEAPEGLFVASDVINLAPATKSVLILTLKRYLGQAADERPRAFPGSDATPIGWAWLREKVRGRDFWRSPRGVSLIAGTAAAILLLVASDSSDDEQPATPFVP